MKKKFIIISLVFYVLLTSFMLYSTDFSVKANATSSIYGKIIVNNCYLKKSPTKLDTLNNYFLLEESYFVKVLSEENEFYYVEYLDLVGYVDKLAISLVNETIDNPYLNNVTFDIIKETNLYSEPSLNENSLITKLDKTINIFYYGKIYADEIFESSGNVWYYCKIENNNQSINGYIHSAYTNNLTPIIQNNVITTNYKINKINSILNLNLSIQTLIIIIISLPLIFITFLFLKGFKSY